MQSVVRGTASTAPHPSPRRTADAARATGILDRKRLRLAICHQPVEQSWQALGHQHSRRRTPIWSYLDGAGCRPRSPFRDQVGSSLPHPGAPRARPADRSTAPLPRRSGSSAGRAPPSAPRHAAARDCGPHRGRDRRSRRPGRCRRPRARAGRRGAGRGPPRAASRSGSLQQHEQCRASAQLRGGMSSGRVSNVGEPRSARDRCPRPNP
jgi:hypothetical protein